eukprot:scaffold7082_cov350-Prasinococcus_capsulatus_cf.AAC.1
MQLAVGDAARLLAAGESEGAGRGSRAAPHAEKAVTLGDVEVLLAALTEGAATGGALGAKLESAASQLQDALSSGPGAPDGGSSATDGAPAGAELLRTVLVFKPAKSGGGAAQA